LKTEHPSHSARRIHAAYYDIDDDANDVDDDDVDYDYNYNYNDDFNDDIGQNQQNK
jgi:hypothetical protein